MPDLLRLDREPGQDRQRAALRDAVREWTGQTLGLDDTATVVVTELACGEPDCPPLEVVIAVFAPHSPRRQCHIHCGLTELDETRVRGAWERNPSCGEHTHD
jgi:hypothetical protein